MSASALEAFAIGVCGFIFVKVLAPGFFARQDTVTPMRIGVIAVVVNVVLSIVLVKTMAHAGLALAISLAAWCNSILLFIVLLKQKIYVPKAGWLWFLCRIGIAVVVMCLCLIYLDQSLEQWYQQGLWQRVRHLSFMVICAATSYFLSLIVLGVRPQQLLLKPVVDK